MTHESYDEIGKIEEEVEVFEEEILSELGFGPIAQAKKDDLLAQIDMKIEELKKHDEPLLSEAAVETLQTLRADVVDHPTRTVEDDTSDMFEDHFKK